MTALAVGVLFILTFVTAIAGVLAYGSVLTDPGYIAGPGADTRVFVGRFFELLLGVVGGSLLTASGIAVLMAVIPQGSALQSIATVPEIIWEAFLGLWFTLKGFRQVPILAPRG